MKKVTLCVVLINFVLGLSPLVQAETIGADSAALQAKLKALKQSAALRMENKDWAYKPVQKFTVPAVNDKKWARTPIDFFILAKLEQQGLKPSPDADRQTFIRRATLDTWGLLPTPEEVDAFERDSSPDAYEKLVDRLLASNHYGERQARRWLDLARYADTAGFLNDEIRPNNWRYRDYVIQAFNEDKPYDQFIREQLAGDEIWPDNQQAKIATGFLAGYPDTAVSRDLLRTKYQIEIDMAELVGETFLAATVGCARCHNHKIDKISQKEYFQFQSFFANVVVNEKMPLEKGTETIWDREFLQQQEMYSATTKDIRAKQTAILDLVRVNGRKYHNGRYNPDAQESIFKPAAEWTALDKWVNHRKESVSAERQIASYLKETTEKTHPEYDAANIERYAEYKKLDDALKKFNSLKPTKGSTWITTVAELGADAPPTHIRFTGIHERPLDAVEPGLPVLWAGNATLNIVPTATSSGRRTALANWIASPTNPLTARVFVNRVWGQYFDKGLAANPGNFGRAGVPPTHPELLDFLATNFVDNGWSVKKLQREILLSRVYRQQSDERKDVTKIDPENKFLAIYPRKRMDAEQVRDSLLYVSGMMNEQIGGPAVYPKMPDNLVTVNSVGDTVWNPVADENENRRRSIYTFVRRSLPYQLTVPFDPADPSRAHHKRDVTTTPLQALALFNSDIVLAWSQALAGRVISKSGRDESAQIDYLYKILFSRSPTRSEKSALKKFLKGQQQLIQHKAWTDRFSVAVPTGLDDNKNMDPFKAAAFVDLVHVVMNSNDFSYRF